VTVLDAQSPTRACKVPPRWWDCVDTSELPAVDIVACPVVFWRICRILHWCILVHAILVSWREIESALMSCMAWAAAFH